MHVADLEAHQLFLNRDASMLEVRDVYAVPSQPQQLARASRCRKLGGHSGSQLWIGAHIKRIDHLSFGPLLSGLLLFFRYL